MEIANVKEMSSVGFCLKVVWCGCQDFRFMWHMEVYSWFLEEHLSWGFLRLVKIAICTRLLNSLYVIFLKGIQTHP